MYRTWATVAALVALYSCISLFNPFLHLSCRRGLRGQATVDAVAQPRRVRQAGHCDEGKNNSVNDYEDLCCSYFSPFLKQTSHQVKLLWTGSGSASWMRLWNQRKLLWRPKEGSLWSECFFLSLEFLQAGLRRNKKRFHIEGIDRPFGGGVESILIRFLMVNWRFGYFFNLILKGLLHKISKKL